MGKLDGKVAVVTGASKGIGAGIAKELAAAGASVAVNYSTDKRGADAVVAEIAKTGGKAVAIQAHVAKANDIRRLFSEVKSAFGKLDVLVNNAGVFSFAPLDGITAEEFHRQFDTNVLGTILMTQEAVKHFGSEGGSVINISSVVSEGHRANMAVYASTKAAVDSITRALASELAPKKIRVNAVAPGLTATEGTTSMGIIGTEQETKAVAGIPMGRVGLPQDIARSVVFLASDDASWVTGVRISASGGQF